MFISKYVSQTIQNLAKIRLTLDFYKLKIHDTVARVLTKQAEIKYIFSKQTG